MTGLFNVDPSTGEVTNLAALDRDGGISQYTLNIQVGILVGQVEWGKKF